MQRPVPPACRSGWHPDLPDQAWTVATRTNHPLPSSNSRSLPPGWKPGSTSARMADATVASHRVSCERKKLRCAPCRSLDSRRNGQRASGGVSWTGDGFVPLVLFRPDGDGCSRVSPLGSPPLFCRSDAVGFVGEHSRPRCGSVCPFTEPMRTQWGRAVWAICPHKRAGRARSPIRLHGSD